MSHSTVADGARAAGRAADPRHEAGAWATRKARPAAKFGDGAIVQREPSARGRISRNGRRFELGDDRNARVGRAFS
jgi:hypothetical protein